MLDTVFPFDLDKGSKQPKFFNPAMNVCDMFGLTPLLKFFMPPKTEATDFC